MNLLARFEEAAERLFTGAVKKNNKPRLQPVEIAKDLVKAMLKHKQVSISNVYVPNIYRVFLHSDDWGPLASFGDAFLIELSKYLFAEGERYGYTFLSKPLIELHADDTVNLREMFIEVDFDDSIDVNWEEEQTEEEINPYWRENTNIFEGSVKTKFFMQDKDSRNSAYYLEIIEGPDKGKIFPFEAGTFYIGRHAQCEVILSDIEISRRHASVTSTEQGWLIDDLGSTNGTLINGQRITRQHLAPGDRVQLGQTVIIVKVGDRSQESVDWR